MALVPQAPPFRETIAMKDNINLSYKDKNRRALEKAYNINQNYFLRVDQPVPFDLDRSFFTAELMEDGIYFKIVKEGHPHSSGCPDRIIGDGF
jgi:hypothetical protein